MHLYMMTRGIKHEVDQFITELQGKYLPFKWRDTNKPDSKIEETYVQLAVRPIQLWELAFPEEQLPVMLSTLFPDGKGGPTQHKKHVKFLKVLRWILGIKECTTPYDNKTRMPVRCQGIEVINVGVKGDYWVSKDGKNIDKKEDGAFEAL